MANEVPDHIKMASEASDRAKIANEAFDRVMKILLSDKPSEISLFNETYLNDPLELQTYTASNFATFSETKISGIPILDLARHFTRFTQYNNDTNNFLHTHWTNFAKLCENSLSKQIQTLYAYLDKIMLLDGYPNMKRFLRRALIHNEFLWTQFLSECMPEAANKVSGLEKGGNVQLVMELMNLTNCSHQQKKHITAFLIQLTNAFTTRDLAANMLKFSITTGKFLKLVQWSLQRIGLVDRGI